MRLPDTLANRCPLLVVAHPGHELRVHAWLEQARPEVWVLTDGSGHGDQGRLASTAALLARAGARPGPLFGRFADRDLYALILRGDVAAIVAVVEQLAAALVEQGIDYVAGDACEGFNPVHDLCRAMVDAAVARARRAGRPALVNFEFPLEAAPGDAGGEGGLSWDLDDAALDRKLAAARAYRELADEVERAVRSHGIAAFRRETFRAVDERAPRRRLAEVPSYERHGEERVAAGVYSQVLRYREHVLPMIDAIAALAPRD